MTIHPYLNFPGTTEEAFGFYRSVFGGEFMMVMRFRETPEADKLPEHELDKIMHISLPLGKNAILMGTDILESAGHKIEYGNNVHLSISPESKEEADRIFQGLSQGGTVAMPMTDMFWGAYFGMVNDRFGISWMINYDYPRA